MRKQKIKALKQQRAQERARGINSNPEIDQAIQRMAGKREEKPKRREIKEKAKVSRSHQPNTGQNLSRAQILRQAEIIKRKQELVFLLKIIHFR